MPLVVCSLRCAIKKVCCTHLYTPKEYEGELKIACLGCWLDFNSKSHSNIIFADHCQIQRNNYITVTEWCPPENLLSGGGGGQGVILHTAGMYSTLVKVAQCLALSPHRKKVQGGVLAWGSVRCSGELSLWLWSLHVLPVPTRISSTMNPDMKICRKDSSPAPMSLARHGVST